MKEGVKVHTPLAGHLPQPLAPSSLDHESSPSQSRTPLLSHLHHPLSPHLTWPRAPL